jgi:ABC-type transport system involved in cytochrome c biogenesis permease subunit
MISRVASLKSLARRLAKPDILFWTLPFIMLLVVLGTLAQKSAGIYAAHQIYFGSFFFLLGGIVPFPGGYTLLGILSLNLLLKFLVASEWSWQKAGIILTHFGALLLLFGGLLTALTAKEGSMVIPQGETRSAVEDYHQRELRILQDGVPVFRLPHEQLKDGLAILDPALPFSLSIDQYCFSCSITKRQPEDQDGWHRPGMFMRLNDDKAKPENEANLTGIEFSVSGLDAEQDGKYLTFDRFPKPPILHADAHDYTIEIGRVQRPLPFSLTLKNFEQDFHPGTMMAKAYRSEVLVKDGDKEWPVVIEMNEPFRYKGYTFYQSSFDESGDTAVTVLSVVQNSGRLFPYISTAVITLGLLLHIALRLTSSSPLAGEKMPQSGRGERAKKYKTLALLFLFLFPGLSHAEEKSPFNMAHFSQIPILHDGRVKPLDTFARINLTAFSGKDHVKKKPAIVWLAETLFDPVEAIKEPIFIIRDENLRHRLGLIERKIPLYNFSEITPGLGKTVEDFQTFSEKEEKTLTREEKNLVTIHRNAISYAQILRSLSLLLPLNVALPPDLAEKAGIKPDRPVSWLDLKKIDKDIEARIKNIIKKKGEDIESYTADEQQLAALGWQIRLMTEAAETNRLLRIAPPQWANENDTGSQKQDWLSPWALVQQGQGSPDTIHLLNVWQNMAQAWLTRDAALWQTATNSALEMPLYLGGISLNDDRKLSLEVAYNQIAPFTVSMVLYALSLVFAIAYFLFRKTSLLIVGSGLLALGFLIHATGIAVRVALLERPPVGTLYESILFVGAVCAAAAGLIETRLRNGTGILIGSVAGVFLGILAGTIAGAADTLQMLGAVLNTQFWLATHVLCITFGYGWCVVTATLAHLILAEKAFSLGEEIRIKQQMKILQNLALVSLLFTAVGTILGGVWADQSWGRFWGWDPKENGALLIVLWLIWLLHGKIAGQISPLVFLGGMAFLNIMVALAWIGVNLLGVGLHSYGFTEGLFSGLIAFILLEFLMVGGMIFKTRKQERENDHAH